MTYFSFLNFSEEGKLDCKEIGEMLFEEKMLKFFERGTKSKNLATVEKMDLANFEENEQRIQNQNKSFQTSDNSKHINKIDSKENQFSENLKEEKILFQDKTKKSSPLSEIESTNKVFVPNSSKHLDKNHSTINIGQEKQTCVQGLKQFDQRIYLNQFPGVLKHIQSERRKFKINSQNENRKLIRFLRKKPLEVHSQSE